MDFCMPLLVVGIDVTRYSQPICNVDFVDFVWTKYRRFNLKKHAILTLPNYRAPIPQMLCLQYYRARIDGWRDIGIGIGIECVEENELAILPLTDCSLQDNCQCNFCVRQPPSLAHLAIHVLMNFTLSLRCLHLTLRRPTTSMPMLAVCRRFRFRPDCRPNTLSSVPGSAVDKTSHNGIIGIALDGGMEYCPEIYL